MAQDGSNSIRNGVLATVLGGIVLSGLAYLWSPLRIALSWLWKQLVQFVDLFTSSYSVPGWALFLLSIVALPAIVQLLSSLRKNPDPPHTSYTEDTIYGAKWRWRWNGSDISNLWCFCPRCDSELVYNDISYGKTDFICEHCSHSVVASVTGGDKGYAISSVQREIRRRVRTNQTPSQTS